MEHQVARPASYFGQPVPGLTPERFALGVVSTDAIELNGVFTPDLAEFFFARLIVEVQGSRCCESPKRHRPRIEMRGRWFGVEWSVAESNR